MNTYFSLIFQSIVALVRAGRGGVCAPHNHSGTHILPSCGPTLLKVFRVLSVQPGEEKEGEIVLEQFLWTRPQSGTHQSWSYSAGQNSVIGTYLMQGTVGNVVQLCVQEKEGFSDMCKNCRSLLQLSPTRRAYLINVFLGIRSAVFIAVRILGERYFLWATESCLHHGSYHLLSMIICSHVNIHIRISTSFHFELQVDCFSNRPVYSLLAVR